MKKSNIIQAVIVLFVLALLILYNVSFPVQKEIAALEIKMDDPTYCVERTIILNGHYQWNLFSADVFSGTLTVSGYESMTADREMLDLQLGDWSPVEYVGKEGADSLILGRLHTTGSFEDSVIFFVNSQSTTDCHVIVANAPSQSAALEIATERFW